MKTKISKIATKRVTAFILAFLMLMLTVTSFNQSHFVQGITNAIFVNADDIRIIEVTEDTKLNADMDADYVYIKSGTLDLNGKTLNVTGNVYVYESAYLDMNGGQVSVGG
ncbi:MAG: hypothetical protein LBM93_11845, partial [Oscillospiraceae bacterium]|nr:hypothetical protein [Oscillospiraceae bacterium]